MPPSLPFLVVYSSLHSEHRNLQRESQSDLGAGSGAERVVTLPESALQLVGSHELRLRRRTVVRRVGGPVHTYSRTLAHATDSSPRWTLSFRAVSARCLWRHEALEGHRRYRGPGARCRSGPRHPFVVRDRDTNGVEVFVTVGPCPRSERARVGCAHPTRPRLFKLFYRYMAIWVDPRRFLPETLVCSVDGRPVVLSVGLQGLDQVAVDASLHGPSGRGCS